MRLPTFMTEKCNDVIIFFRIFYFLLIFLKLIIIKIEWSASKRNLQNYLNRWRKRTLSTSRENRSYCIISTTSNFYRNEKQRRISRDSQRFRTLQKVLFNLTFLAYCYFFTFKIFCTPLELKMLNYVTSR